MAKKKTLSVDPRHIADAAIIAAKANHYLVRLTPLREDDADEAWQLLIEHENAGDITSDEMELTGFLLDEALGLSYRKYK